jgi:exopolysaccharide biosynthesis protein
VAGAFRAPAASTTTTPFLGIKLTHRTETSPRALDIWVAQIDLTAPGIHFGVTDANGSLPEETTRQTTRAFVTQERAQLGINASFFSVNTGAYANNSGLVASAGDVYSPMSDYHAMNISAANAVTFMRPVNQGGGVWTPSPNAALWNAVAGNQRLLNNGANAAVYNGIAARTAAGVTQNGKTLILFTVDGGDSDTSAGMSTIEVADMLQDDYGAYNALNLDGGGSTTMVLANPVARVLGNPSAGSERAVGTNLAVFASPLPEPGSCLAILSLAALALRRNRPRE